MFRRERQAKKKSVRASGQGLSWWERLKWRRQNFREQAAQIFSVILLIALIIVPVAIFGWLLFFTEIFRVQAINVIDAREHTTQEVKEIVSKATEKLPFKQNILFVQSEAIEVRILGQLPQVRTVQVTRKLPSTLKVIVQEKEAALLLLSSGRYYLVDEEGIAFEEARLETLPGVVLPVVKNDDQSAMVKLGARAVEATFVTFVRNLEAVLTPAVSARPAEIHIPSLAAREMHVRLDNNWRLLLDATRPATVQGEVLRRLMQETIRAEQKALIEYIDLRIPNRVYYKLREEISHTENIPRR